MTNDRDFRIAILGTESSHATAFAQLIRRTAGMELIGAYGADPEANKRFEAQFTVPVTEDPTAFVPVADAVMITTRDGGSHLPLVRPYLRPSMTAFIDKPFCRSVPDAENLVRTARQQGTRLCGGSSLKYAPRIRMLKKWIASSDVPVIGASFSAPVELQSPYGGFKFYAAHLIEMALGVFGYEGMRAVRAIRHENAVTALLIYDRFCVSLFFGCNAYTANIAFSTYVKTLEITDIPGLYGKEFAVFRSLVRRRSMPISDPECLIAPVRITNAIEESFETDREVELRFPF